MIHWSWQDIKGSLTVAFVATAILFFTYTAQIFVIWPYLGSVSTNSILILAPLNFFVLMVLINYYLTCKTDPGSVPVRWVI
jgi:palmitoyltransferase